MKSMEDAANNQAQTEPDMSGDGHTPENSLKITVEEAAALFEAGGVPRNKRSIRKYCKRGDLTTCVVVDTEHGRLSSEGRRR